MEYKWIKKVMIFGMAMSLLVGIAPTQAFAKKNKGVELFGEESFETEAQTSATESQSEPPTVTANPTPSGTTAQSYAGAIQPIANMNEPTASGDLEQNGDNYTVKSYATLTFDGSQCGEIEVVEGAELHITVSGINPSTIESIIGAGSVVFEADSDGRVTVTNGISVAQIKVNGGTIFSEASVSSQQVIINGGTIAQEGLAAKREENSGFKDLQSVLISGLPENAICTIDRIDHATGYPSDVWSDQNGQAVLYIEGAQKIELTTFALDESAGILTAKRQSYEYNVTKKSLLFFSEATSSVKVGAELNSSYGVSVAKEADAVVVENSTSESLLVLGTPTLMADYQDWQNKLKIETGVQGAKIKQTNLKEIPGDYTYIVSVPVRDEKGYNHTIKGTVTYKVSKKELKIRVVDENGLDVKSVTKKYNGDTDVPQFSCYPKFEDAAEDDEVTGTAKFVFDDPNVLGAKEIIVESIDLDDKWDPFYTCNKELKNKVSGTITKAPCPKTPQEIEKVEATHDKIKFQGVEGQEYAFNAEGKSKSGWTALESNNTCTISKLSSDTTYTLYTRIAATRNYEASDEVSTEVKTTRKPYTASASGVSISGITDNSSYTVGTKLTLTAKGVEPEDDDYSEGDERYVPYSWKLNNETVWKKAPYTAQITPDKEGTYTIAVKFHKQVYNGKKWVRDKKGDTTKTVTFKATSSGSSSGSTSSSNGSSSSVVRSTTAAKTEDPTDPRRLVILIVVFVISGAVIAMTMRKKKDHK